MPTNKEIATLLTNQWGDEYDLHEDFAPEVMLDLLDRVVAALAERTEACAKVAELDSILEWSGWGAASPCFPISRMYFSNSYCSSLCAACRSAADEQE